VAIGLSFTSAGFATADPGDDGGIVPTNPASPSGPIITRPPGVVTPDAVELSRRLGLIAEQQSCGGDCQYWFTLAWDAQDPRLTDYTTWTWYKINGRSDLFFVEAQGSAYTHDGYALTRFEPWIRSATSPAQLGDRNPLGNTPAGDGQPITVGLSYSGASVSTTFSAAASTYNPFAWATHYSLEWQGFKGPFVTVANQYETRWFNGEPWGMEIANCGRGDIVWGNCSNR
jgi:hypothetical protein